MIAVAGLAVGAVSGAVVAHRRGGKRLDMLHYAGAYGILFALLGMFLTVALDRML